MMKSTVKQDYFIISSPEDELKYISLSNNIEKVSYESQRTSKKSSERFAIDSWDISHQKLKPFQNLTQREKQTFSNNFSPKLNKSRYKARSAFLKKDLQNTNSHNFNSKKKCSLQVCTERKFSSFFSQPFNSIEKAKVSLSQSKQTIKNQKKTVKSKITIERQLKQQQQARSKTIQSYLIHQKQIINREKYILMSQRIGKQGIISCVYPTEYWKGVNCTSPIKKSRKLKMNKTPLRITTSRERISTINSKSPVRTLNQKNKIEECQQSRSTQSQSPIKRFRQFKQKLQHIAIH